jgi:hypothetical protein
MTTHTKSQQLAEIVSAIDARSPYANRKLDEASAHILAQAKALEAAREALKSC